MKKFVLPLLICVLLLCACAKAEELQTAIGNYTISQDFVTDIQTNTGQDVTAAPGNILLVITLTPEEGVTIDLDRADEYFMNGTKATLDDQEYDIKCVVYERNSAGDPVIKCRLVFEVMDNGYAEAAEQPKVGLTLPSVP
jgi:hypothetical protein